ncbi:MAG TPA: type II secretion system F family protein [Gemmatimonadaceae bacterium]|nr:type II secretion system F family protein [Gemmatimonadaceae bacterium]
MATTVHSGESSAFTVAAHSVDPATVTLPAEKLQALLRPLSKMLTEGFPTVAALQALAASIEDEQYAGVCRGLADLVNDGMALGKAMEEYPRVFSPMMTAVITAGESSGQVPVALRTMAARLKRTQETSRKVKKAAYYPAALLLFVLASTLGSLAFIVPQTAALYENIPAESLPFSTRALLLASGVYRAHMYFYTLLVILALVGLVVWARSYSGSQLLKSLVLRIPLIEGLAAQVVRARFLEDLALLQRNLGNLRESIRLACDAVPFPDIEAVLRNMGDSIYLQGLGLAAAMQQTGFFPETVIAYVEAGESSGGIVEMATAAAETETEAANEKLDAVLELLPIPLIVIVAVFVSGLVWALWAGTLNYLSVAQP